MSPRPAVADPLWVRVGLTALALVFLAGFLVLPLAAVFAQAFEQGWRAYLAALAAPDTKAAVLLTVTVAVLAVPLNTAFGIAAAWAIARFHFPGKRTLVTLIDLPFAVSPVVSGLVFVLLFGAQGRFGPWLIDHGYKVIFALPGLVLATLFVTCLLYTSDAADE